MPMTATKTDMSAGGHIPPRTAELPMAFTVAEFVRGAVAAWVAFLVLATAAYAAVIQGYVVVATAFYVPWSLGAALVGSPAAYLLGRSLRRVRRIAVHIAAFAALGAAVGLAATIVFVAVYGHGNGGTLYYVVNLALSVIAVPLGWYWTARRALRHPRPRVDPDAMAEDAAAAGGPHTDGDAR